VQGLEDGEKKKKRNEDNGDYLTTTTLKVGNGQNDWPNLPTFSPKISSNLLFTLFCIFQNIKPSL
jgi:hypothetical protein